MGISATAGSFGIGIQTTKGTPAATINYIKAINIGFQPEQAAQSVPPEVGGTMWPSGSFKTGVTLGGDVTVYGRTRSLGWLLRAFAGTATSAAGAEASTYSHTFREATNQSFLPWCTVTKNVSDIWAERYTDCRVSALSLDIPAAGLMTATFSVAGITPDEISVPTESYVDDDYLFVGCVGSVKFDGTGTYKATRVRIDFANNITNDERVVGSYYLDDLTMMSRSARITCDTFLTTADWYRATYNNAGTTWDPAVVSAELDLTINSAEAAVSGGTAKGEFRLVIPNIDYLAYPVPLAGGDLVRTTLTAELTVPGNEIPFYMQLLNGQSAYALS